MVNQVSKLPQLNAAQAKALTEALSASAYDAAGKAALQGSIDAKVNTETAGPTSSNKYQYFHEAQLTHYTRQDWFDLRSDSKSLQCKIQVVVDRWVRLGVSNPDEWSYAWGVGIVVPSHFPQFPS